MSEQEDVTRAEEPCWFLAEDPLYLSVVRLGARGWTERMVRRFLGRPDRWGSVEHWKNWTGKRLYYLGRVEIAEGLPDFERVFARSARRRKLPPERVEAFLEERRKTRGLAQDQRAAMTPEECKVSALVERASNLLLFSTPRGRVLAAYYGIKPPAFLRRRRRGGTK